MNIKNEIEKLRAWRAQNLQSPLPNWESRERDENEIFSAHAAMYLIQLKTNHAIAAYKFVHRCSLEAAAKAIAAGEEQIEMDTSL